MKRGLVIGKFLPLHLGHMALIDFAARRCDQLIVSMSYTNSDPIDKHIRFSWLKETYESHSKIKLGLIEDDFDDETLPWVERTNVWAEVVKKHYPPIDVIFSSEVYGEPFARNLKALHVSFDPARRNLPVSASAIREAPFKFWNFIPSVVRPYFVKKVCLYGPESTGKSVMSKILAEKFNTVFVPEVARELITDNQFNVDDIVRIGYAQHQRIMDKIAEANKILFCDTDLITTQIYSQYYLNNVPPILLELERKVKYDHYFLFHADVPWVADGLRDLGERRDEMLALFKNALDERKIIYTSVKGSWAERENIILDKISSWNI